VELLTKESRGVLPATLPYFDAVRSINAAAYLVAAFATGDYARLRDAAGDFMHEPYRLPKIRGGRDAIAAGLAAGALTGWLSGSGSSVLCVADVASTPAVGAAMVAAFAAAGVPAEARDLAADNVGYVVEG
jgi:homoserine kinase